MNKIKLLILFAGALIGNLNAKLNHPLFKDLSALESRPIRTLPAVEMATHFGNYFNTTALAGSTLFFPKDSSKKILPNFFAPGVSQLLIDLTPTPGELDEFADNFGKATKIISNFSTEYNRLGAILNLGVLFGEQGLEEEADQAYWLGIQIPILLNFAHFFLPFSDQKQLRQFFSQNKDLIIATFTSLADEAALNDSINLSDFKPFLTATNFDPVDLCFDLYLPAMASKRFNARFGAEAVLSFDLRSPTIPSYLSISRPELAEFTATGDTNDDLLNLMQTIFNNAKTVGLKSVLAALYNTRVVSYAQKWGHSLGPVFKAELSLVPDCLTFFFNSRINWILGQTRNVILAVEGLDELCQFSAQTGNRLMGNANCGFCWQKKRFNLKVGYDFFGATAQKIDFVFDAYNQVTKIDYFAKNKLSLADAANNLVWQHRLFAGLNYDYSPDTKLHLNADFAINAHFLPKTLNLTGGVSWIF